MDLPSIQKKTTESEFTVRWSFRSGDFLVWLQLPGFFSSVTDFTIADLWYMRDGDFATITNRPCDLPSWFDLHPSEVADSLVHEMMSKLEQGYVPGEVIEGPNIWRVPAGGRLVWIGSRRFEFGPSKDVLGVLDCKHSVLVIGEGRYADLEEMMTFGKIESYQPDAEQTVMLGKALAAAIALGIPRTFETSWALG